MTEFAKAIATFDGAVRRTLATCAEIPPQVWAVRPQNGGFSIAEALEHMAISNGLFAGRLRAILDSPAAERPVAVLEDDEVPHLFERATEPPGIAEPTGAWLDRDDALARFAGSAQPVSAVADADSGDLRHKGARHPIFGPLDGVQWAMFAAAHTERHRSEIIGLAAVAGDAHPA